MAELEQCKNWLLSCKNASGLLPMFLIVAAEFKYQYANNSLLFDAIVVAVIANLAFPFSLLYFPFFSPFAGCFSKCLIQQSLRHVHSCYSSYILLYFFSDQPLFAFFQQLIGCHFWCFQCLLPSLLHCWCYIPFNFLLEPCW